MPAKRLLFIPPGDGAFTARAFPLLRDERVIVGAFCAMSEECYGLFFEEGSAMVMRFEPVPADIVTASLDSYLFPVAHADGRTLAVVQFQSVHPQIRDAAALVAHDEQTNSWSVWRSAERAVCSETDGVVAWLAPAGIELLSPTTAASRATFPLTKGARPDFIACDREGRHAAYASGSRVTLIGSSGEIGREWVLPDACSTLRFRDRSDGLFAFLRNGGLVRLLQSGETVEHSRPGLRCLEVDSAGSDGFFLADDGQLHRIELETGREFVSQLVTDAQSFRDGVVVIEVEPRTGSVAVLNRDEMSVSVFSATRQNGS